MLLLYAVLVLCVTAESVVQNFTCPVVQPRELDLKELDGKWYLAAVSTDLEIEGDCATVTFSHKTDNTTDVSISWIANNTVNYYNGSVALTFDPNSNETNGDLLSVTYTNDKTETYSFLDVDYEHYAIMFLCTENAEDNSTAYEVWELTRAPHAKPKHVSKIANSLTLYNLETTVFINFNNTEETCKGNGGCYFNPSTLMMALAAALALFQRLY